MSFFEIDASEFFIKLDNTLERAVIGAKEGVDRSTEDLELIATNIAPVDTTALRASAKSKVTRWGNKFERKVIGEVWFSATNVSPGYGPFNYAIWTHEYTYNLGPKSRAAGGFAGYSVGNKYLTRPLFGESEKYFRWWAESIRRAIAE